MLMLAGAGSIRADEAVDYQNFVRAVNEQKDTLVTSAKRVTVGFSFSREEGMSDDQWRTVIDHVADVLSTTAGDFATVERSLEFARSAMPEGTGLSFHVGFSDTK